MANTEKKSGDKIQQDAEDARTLKGSNTVKDPDEWTTGREPVTGAQQSYLKTLSEEVREQVGTNLTKAEASKRIDELQHKTGSGLGN